ncbi:hypothetical protein ElyMa_002584200 [Elysia marginata]|uniref:Uncharacterized protein n=1 Tax=Elysia marginata TaxID=1093978 RepID=A0AAV4H1I3_9GAST|nr:hypothetical protein ElyMa_002584200 [Elysia marginata]
MNRTPELLVYGLKSFTAEGSLKTLHNYPSRPMHTKASLIHISEHHNTGLLGARILTFYKCQDLGTHFKGGLTEESVDKLLSYGGCNMRRGWESNP